jgi:hypothetical protein
LTDKIIYIDKNDKLNLSRLHDNQKKFIKSQYLHTGIVGGYQSGKSLAACTKVIVKQLQDPNVPIAYYLPTYGLIDDMLVPKFDKLYSDLEINYRYYKAESKIVSPYGEVWMRSMDNPDRIVSYSVGYSLVDEVDVVHPNRRTDAMKRISSRNSFKKSTKNCIDFVSTPEGYAYMYNFFVKNKNENKLLLNLQTLDNKNNLGEGYIDGLREQYDEVQLKAYLEGEFVNLNSRNVYYNFNRYENHSDRSLQEHETIFIGMDFNVGNMNAVIHVIDSIPIAVDELTGIYDTPQMCAIIKKRFPTNKVVVYPDSSGKNRKTSTTKTDIGILKEFGFMAKYRDSNPDVSDRIKNMNRMFKDGHGNVRYKVNTKKCPSYTEALERMPTDKHGQPDKTSGFDHITEAGGYFIYYEYPLIKRLGQGLIKTR